MKRLAFPFFALLQTTFYNLQTVLSYNEIRPKIVIELDGEPYRVLSAKVFRKQKQKPVNQTKLKHLASGRVVEHTFQQSDAVEEADVTTKAVRYLFHKHNRQTDTDEYWFCEKNDPSKRFMIARALLEDELPYLKENEIVQVVGFREQVIGVAVPIKMTLAVAEAPPNIKGNTAQGGTKQVVLETGAVVTTPMFIETGDIIEINTESGKYVRRVN